MRGSNPVKLGAWFQEKNQEFWTALNAGDHQRTVDIVAMVSGLYSDPAGDRELASPGMAEMFESLATFWIGVGKEAEGGEFAQRALAIRRHLAYLQLRSVDMDVIVVDKELKAMIDNPMDVPGPAFAPEGLLMEVSRQVVAGLWQSQGLPREQLALEVAVDLPWRLVLRHKRLGFTFINLESPETDAEGLGALPLFYDLATLDGERGRTNKPYILSRGVLRLPVKSARLGIEEKIRVGWILVQLQQVGPG